MNTSGSDDRTVRLMLLSEWSGLSGAASFRRYDRHQVRDVVSIVVHETGKGPGLFLDEQDQIEARWVLHPDSTRPARIVNVSFGDGVSVYVYDRATGEVSCEAEYPRGLETAALATLVVDLVRWAEDPTGDLVTSGGA